MASSLLIKSYNVNSIGKNPKRSEIFRFLRKKGGDVQILLDTRFSKEIEPKVKEEWGAQVYFSSFSSQSRGVAIFLKNNLPVEILKEKSDESGNILSLLFKYDDETILLTGIYGPNEDNPAFYKNKIFHLIDEWQTSFTVYSGDWNLVLDKDLQKRT